jgi:hypothetical protein
MYGEVSRHENAEDDYESIFPQTGYDNVSGGTPEKL